MDPESKAWTHRGSVADGLHHPAGLEGVVEEVVVVRRVLVGDRLDHLVGSRVRVLMVRMIQKVQLYVEG